MVIWKYELPVDGSHKIKIPEGAKGLSVQWKKDKLCLWCLVDQNNITETREVAIYGTGHDLPEKFGDYVGTFQMYGGNLIFHVFLI